MSNLLFTFQGISVETICSVLRNLPYLQKVATNYSLIILCDVTDYDPNSIEVIVVSLTFIDYPVRCDQLQPKLY